MDVKLVTLVTALFTASATASECDIEMGQSVQVEPHQITLLKQEQPQVVMEQDYLAIQGKPISLNTEQKELLNEYQEELRNLVPEVISVAMGATKIALTAVNQAMVGITGSEQHNLELAELTGSLKTLFSQDGDTYYLSGYKDEALEEQLDAQIGKVMEKMMGTLMGSIFTSMGEAMSSPDGDFASNTQAMVQRFEKMEQQIEEQVEAQAKELGESAEALCQKAMALEKTEQKLHLKIPELKKFDLLTI